MARVSPKQHSFARGEISPRLYSRQDTELYYTALEVARNYVVDGRGILERRPGTRLLGTTKDNGAASLVPFVYDQQQSYLLELGEQYLRAWFDFGLVLDSGSPSETATPYSAEETADLSFSQARDVMWLAHAEHPPSTIQRETANTFAFSSFDTRDGPYLDTNPDQDNLLEIEAVGLTANVGRGSFSDSDPLTDPDIPANLIVGSIIKVWDGTALRTITVQSVDSMNSQVETNWTGTPIASTEQWSYDGNSAPAGVALTVEGVSGVTTATLRATGGHTPFDAARDAGRWVRLLQEDQDAEESASLEERFQWHSFKIVSVSSSTEASIEWEGGDVPATADWRLGSFYVGNYPSVVAFHQNRLCFALRNKIYMSSSGDYDNFAPSDVDSSVNPDNAITISIPATSAKKGAVSDVTFLQSLGFQLVVGTPSGIHTLQSSNLGEGFDASNPPTRRPQDSRGAALAEPVIIGDSIVYLHSSRQKLMGTYYRDSYERLGAQDLSLPSDHITVAKIKGVTWQEEPHSIAWCHMDDGTVAGLTIQPEEKVQAWHTHRLGGKFVSGGVTYPAQVESMASRPAPDGGDDSLHMIVKRTVNGATVRHIEAMQEFRDLGSDPRNSWYLDAALKYEGNTDAAKSITFTGTGTGSRSAVTNFTDPAMIEGDTLCFHDGTRWHHGRISDVDGSNDFTWAPTLPNSPPGPADGRWHYVDGAWVQLASNVKIDVYANTYVEPANQTAVTRWSFGVNTLSGLGDYEGEQLDLLLDGFPIMGKTVASGEISGLPNGHVILAGLGYESRGRLMSIEAGSQNGSAQDKQRPVYEVVIDVLESMHLEAGTDMPSSYEGAWQQFDPVKFPDAHAIIEGEPVPLYSGMVRVSRDEQGDVTDPSVAWRQVKPLPSTIRGVITRLSQSDGR